MKILSREFLTKVIEFGRAYRATKQCNNELKAKQKVYPYTGSNKHYHKAIRKLFGGGKSYYWNEFYNNFNTVSESYNINYIPDNLYYGIIDIFYNNYTKCLAIDDKNLYDCYFKDCKLPNTILRKSNNVLMDKNYNVIKISKALDILKSISCGVIIKKSVVSEGGKNIHVWTPDESVEKFQEILDKYSDCVVQELIRQHESLSYLHKDSVNTIRIVTWNNKGDIIPLSAIVRMGVNGSKVDNASSGGIFCGINRDGTLKDVAYNTSGKSFTTHPQGAIFKGHKIANFDKCVSIVKLLAPRFSSFSRLTSWDVCLDENGTPIVIEANLAYGELDFHQIANGPLFGEYTEDMLREVFSIKSNRRLRKVLNIL